MCTPERGCAGKMARWRERPGGTPSARTRFSKGVVQHHVVHRLVRLLQRLRHNHALSCSSSRGTTTSRPDVELGTCTSSPSPAFGWLLRCCAVRLPQSLPCPPLRCRKPLTAHAQSPTRRQAAGLHHNGCAALRDECLGCCWVGEGFVLRRGDVVPAGGTWGDGSRAWLEVGESGCGDPSPKRSTQIGVQQPTCRHAAQC